MSEFQTALRYCRDKLLKMTQDKDGYRLFCYTKSCFFGKDTWDDVTTSHRGKLYYENRPVNKPFKKIFNLGEVASTETELIYEKMKNEKYEILDKANGHLFIVSLFQDSKGKQHVVFSTKGSLPNAENDLLNKDILIFNDLYGEQLDKVCSIMPNTTLMFESIVSHDKHSMYDLQVKQYGQENCFVLLGVANKLSNDLDDEVLTTTFHSIDNKTMLSADPWVEVDWNKMNQLAQFIGCPVIEKYDEVAGEPEMWKEHKDREGYVIRFLSDNTRVKIKTSDYWKNRFKKDLTPEVLLSTFKKGGFDSIQEKMPEEVVYSLVDFLDRMFITWYMDILIKYNDEIAPYFKLYEGEFDSTFKKWLFTDSEFNEYQRRHIANILDKKYCDYSQYKNLRELFYDYAIEDRYVFHRLKEVVYNAL
jgi:hypothetical protein